MIETLRVQNYKSLKDVIIPLKPLTVLVGPNAAGKSNILDCLAFLTDIANHGQIERPFEKRGGYGDTFWGGRSNEAISLSCKWQPREDGSGQFSYSLTVRQAQPRESPTIEEELLSSMAPGGVSFRRTENIVHIGDNSYGLPSQQSLFVARPETLVRHARKIIANWTYYDLVTHGMRLRQNVLKQTRLVPDGSNIATLLHWIFSEERKVFSQVEEHLKAAIPEVEELLSRLTEDGKTYVAWREKDIPGQIPAWNMSEGSVRLVTLGAFSAATSPTRHL